MNSEGKSKPAKTGADASTPAETKRGRKNVEARLIRATCEQLSKQGPRGVTIRDIAIRAGVNHGQIHHYFGGKKGLIEAAVLHLARQHTEHTAQREQDGLDAPPPLTLGQDNTYVMSIIRLVLDGELELATAQLAQGKSVPREMMAATTRSLGYRKPTTEIKAAFASAMAIEWAWAALELYILRVVDARPNEVQKIRQQVGDISRQAIRQLEPKK